MGSYGYADGWQYFMSTVSDVLKQVRACEAGIRMRTVLESGGWCRTLKGVLWWLVVVLLVGGTLANQVSESRGTAAPLSGQKGMVHVGVWLGDGGVCPGDLVEFLLLHLLTNCLTTRLNAILCAVMYVKALIWVLMR